MTTNEHERKQEIIILRRLIRQAQLPAKTIYKMVDRINKLKSMTPKLKQQTS